MDIDSAQEMENELSPVSMNLFEQMFLDDNKMYFQHAENSNESHSPLPITEILESAPSENLDNHKAPSCNATCFSLFPDAGMADLLGALDSRNDGEQKCISR
jgi:hypothetical protein